jgi:hypothetical protein
MTYTHLSIIFLALLTSHNGCLALNDVTNATYRQSSRRDVIFNDNLIFQVRARSKSECARFCRRESCLTFTFQPSATLNCRGHSVDMTSSMNFQAGLGARVYAVVQSECFHVQALYSFIG